jgi:hypothetical protein
VNEKKTPGAKARVWTEEALRRHPEIADKIDLPPGWGAERAPAVPGGPVHSALGDGSLITDYSVRWDVPAVELDLTLRALAHGLVASTYTEAADKLGRQGAPKEIVVWLIEQARASQEAAYAVLAPLARLRSVEPGQFSLTREMAEDLGIDFDKLKEEGL